MQNNNSKWINSFKQLIFGASPFDFEEQAIQLFRFQYRENSVYQTYCQLINCKVEEVNSIQEIPFLPIASFKNHPVKSEAFDPQICFESSGTTGSISSKHYVKDLSIYEKSFCKGFEKFYGPIEEFCVLGLLPSYLERKGSSLVYMVDSFIKQSKFEESGFFLHDTEALKNLLNRLNQTQEKVLLIGVSFGLLDFVEQYQLASNDQLVVMETGGMKGRRKELVREELHQLLQKGFNTETIHSEYGMTELLSQAYAMQHGHFKTPAWMKVLTRKQDDPFSYCQPGESGALNIIDLANIHSCAFIQTDDLGRINKDGSFQVLGRFDASEVRGCNLMVS